MRLKSVSWASCRSW